MIYKNFSTSSKIWLKKNFKDKFVKESIEKKLRSRSWFKLDEINAKERIFKNNMTIVDLGSYPGGWSKYASKYIKKNGKIISCDIKNMNFIDGVTFYKGDLLNKKFLKYFISVIKNIGVDVIMSDMSPNITGNKCVDSQNSTNLLKISFYICKKIFIKKGTYISKIFQCKDFNNNINVLKNFFINLKTFKLKSSRSNSSELFVVGKGIK
ncbi:RlmE family RNA methyltransferase [Buchnera aphidicola (Ceratoglyphina bambusae)]|uniref:RlmE family RNA methyltransferase n=1 Tax=Buchnera aphidicola TaxID=9 RepID=UPI0031B840FB